MLILLNFTNVVITKVIAKIWEHSLKDFIQKYTGWKRKQR